MVNTIELRLDDIYQAPASGRGGRKDRRPKIAAKTWMEQFQQILGALNSEKVVTALTIGLIQLVAALNILITLIMMVVEKNRDIAVLMSMGAKRQQIRKIFVLEGLLIGVVGTAIGLMLGYSLSYLADHYHWLRLNAEVYSLPMFHSMRAGRTASGSQPRLFLSASSRHCTRPRARRASRRWKR